QIGRNARKTGSRICPIIRYPTDRSGANGQRGYRCTPCTIRRRYDHFGDFKLWGHHSGIQIRYGRARGEKSAYFPKKTASKNLGARKKIGIRPKTTEEDQINKFLGPSVPKVRLSGDLHRPRTNPWGQIA